MRRFLLPLLVATLTGCSTVDGSTPWSLVTAGVSAGSFIVLQRGIVDAAVSLAKGQDCSVLHLERRGEYCRTVAAVSEPPFCTRSLGGVDCWTEYEPYGPQRPVADTPAPAEREAVRWPPL